MEAIQKRASAPKSLQVAAAVIGNALEWYDFVIFGFLELFHVWRNRRGILAAVGL